jgi:hypothetical protein
LSTATRFDVAVAGECPCLLTDSGSVLDAALFQHMLPCVHIAGLSGGMVPCEVHHFASEWQLHVPLTAHKQEDRAGPSLVKQWMHQRRQLAVMHDA